MSERPAYAVQYACGLVRPSTSAPPRCPTCGACQRFLASADTPERPCQAQQKESS